MLCHDIFFLFNDPSTSEIYTLSLHDALPIWNGISLGLVDNTANAFSIAEGSNNYLNINTTNTSENVSLDRKSTRLNSSHVRISYAVFCLKKKKKSRLSLIKLKIDAASSSNEN